MLIRDLFTTIPAVRELQRRQTDDAAERFMHDLAARFVERLKEELGPEKFSAMQHLNAAADPGVCHSHDYCDSNMTMLWAFCDLTGQKEDDVDLEACTGLFNAAWDYAKTRGLGQRA